MIAVTRPPSRKSLISRLVATNVLQAIEKRRLVEDGNDYQKILRKASTREDETLIRQLARWK